MKASTLLRSRLYSAAALTCATLTFSLATPSRAADGTWLGVSGTWSNNAIWSGGIVADGIDSKANFVGVNIGATRLITNDIPRTIGTINFTDATTASHNLAISGSSLTLDVSTGAPAINVTNQILTLSNAIAGTKGFVKGGAGTLILTANSTGLVGSNVPVLAGSLRLSVNAGALGGASGPTVLLGNPAVGSTAAANFEAGNSINVANPIIVQSGPTSPGLRTISSAAAISPTFSGAITASESVRILQDNAGGTLNISGAGSSIAAGKTVSFLDNEIGNLTDNAPWSGDGAITYSTTSSTSGGGTISIGGQKTHTGGSQILSMAGNTNTPSTAAVTANSTGPAGSPTSGPFGTGTLVLSAGRLRATTNADITIANTAIVSGNTIFPSVANEKSLTFTGPVTLTSNRTFTVDVGTTVPGEFVEFQGALGQSAGPFSFTKAGTGVLLLGGVNTYSGNTVVSGGTLQLGASASLNSSPVITLGTNTVLDVTPKAGTFDVPVGQTLVANGATVTGGINVSGALTLTGGGKANATTTVNNAGTLNVNGPGSVTNLTFANTAALNVNVGAGGLLTVTANDGLSNIGVAGSVVINLTDIVSPVPGTYTLIAYAGNLQNTGFSAYQLGAVPPGASYALLDTPGAVQLVVTPLLTWTGLESSEWSINPFFGAKNWQLSGTPTDYTDGQDVTFDDSATGTTTVDISVADVTPTRVIVNNSLLNYTLQGSSGIGGSAALFKRGTNSLTIKNFNTYTGPTTITAGQLILEDSVLFDTSVITNNSSLICNYSSFVTVYMTRPIVGTGTLTKQGAGTLILSATNNYNGATLVSAGTLQLGATNIIPDGPGKTGVTVNGTFDLNGFSETINGLGGSGLVDNAGAGAATLTIGGNSASSTFNGVIANSGAALNLVKIGTGTSTFSNANTFTGSVNVTAGTLALGNLNTFDNVASITLAGGATLRPNFSNIVLNLPISLGSNGSTATITAPGPGEPGDVVAVTLNGVIGGAGNMLLNGVNGNNSFGTVILNAQSTYSGSTTLDSAGNNANLFVRLGTNNALPVTTVLILDGGVGTGSGRSVELNLNGFSQTVAGLTNILSTPRRLQRVINNSLTPATLTVNNTADYTYLGQLGNTAPNGNFALVKSGPGTFTIDPSTTATNGTTILNNFYTGGTVINAGTLLVNNPAGSGSGTGSGAVTVNGGTLGGTGFIAGSVTVNAGGTFSPGASIGTLTINSNLTLAGTTFIEVSKTGGTRDQVVGISNAIYGGTLIVSNLAGTLAAGDSFAVFSATTPSGNFTSITPAPGPGLGWNFNPATGVLSVVAVNNVQLLSLTRNSAGDLSTSGTGGVPFANYVVVTATNMSIPLISWTPIQTNAFDAGGNFTITISNAVTAPVRSQFYRMVEPNP